MKKIVLTQRLIENDSYFEVREALDVNYSKLLSQAGFLPIVIPYDVDFKKYFDEINIEGVVLTGGNDLFSCNQNQLSMKRDTFEKDLLNYSILNNIPVLGICRGMQLIAEYFGSTFKKVENQVNITHSLIVERDSKYLTYLKRLNIVNSYHDFGIETLSETLKVSAKSKDNIIKAIEHKECKVFGQMWHSERENPFSIDEINLIKGFFSDR